MSLSDSVSERLLRERIILLGSEVRDTNANEITAQLLLLAAEDPEKDITLYINSPGGIVTAGMAIYDTMMLIEPRRGDHRDGPGRLDGPVPADRRRQGKRAALPHARILMHQPSAGVGGTAADIAIQAEHADQVQAGDDRAHARTPASPSSGSTTTRTATAGSPRRRPWSTASSTRSSPGRRRRRHRRTDPSRRSDR